MLQVQGLVAGYATGPVLHGIDLELQEGEIVTLIGANGAGKSTLVQCISGLKTPMSGRIRFEGTPIEALSPAQRLRLGIAHVPEGRQVFAGMTVAENLALGGHAGRAAGQPAERLADVFRLFPVLRERQRDIVGNFSGGQQQMLAIGRGLMSAPRVLVLDEPTLGLSPLLVAEVFRLVQRLRDMGITILLAEQNARSALHVADRGYVIENGQVTMSGRARDLLNSPDVTARFLGGRSAGASHDADDARRSQDFAEALARCVGAGSGAGPMSGDAPR